MTTLNARSAANMRGIANVGPAHWAPTQRMRLLIRQSAKSSSYVQESKLLPQLEELSKDDEPPIPESKDP
jgi:hypothetical protein